MAKLNIVTDEKVLRQKSKSIDKITPDIKTLVRDMLETMYSAQGVGLAAVQVGIHKRIVVIDVSETKDQPLALINPKIVAGSGCVNSKEGCLSVPGVDGKVERKEVLTVISRTISGETVKFEADGLFAICIQHELDHLEGVLFIDKIIPGTYEET